MRRGAVFDLDGVIVDNSRFHRQAWRELSREEGFELPAGEWWRLTIGRPVEDAVPQILRRALSPAEVTRLAQRKIALYHELADGHAAAVPGVVEFVRSLPVPAALATSAIPESARAILGAVDLRDAFAACVTARDVTRGKPDPEVYLAAAAKLGVPGEACVAFEDAVVGIESARRAGMAVIGLTTAHPADELLAAGAARAIADFTSLTWKDLAAL
jgi:HAD superfamily hydrolase (TIGR01509 family)